MDTPRRAVTSRQIGAALAIAVAVDILQIPVLVGMLAIPTGIPAEALDVAVDVGAAIAINRLLGFHWVLLPTLALEMIPVVDAAPTWTACVAYVAMRRRRAQQQAQP